MRLLRKLLWVTLTVAWPYAVQADESLLIELKGTELFGLPEKYAPAELDMKTFRLRIGKKEMTFPPFLAAFFEHPHDLRISAPKYRYPDFPTWLRFHIEPKKKDFSYDLFLNLDTLELQGMSILLQTSDTSMRKLSIWSEDLKKEITKSIRTLK